MKAVVVDLPAVPRPAPSVAAVAILVLVLFLGISLVVARELAGRCETTDGCLATGTSRTDCLATGTGPTDVLATGTKAKRCELAAWDLHVPVPEQVANILRRLGARFS
jgi:hypothetical protein